MQRVLPCILLGSVTTVIVSGGINSACGHNVSCLWKAALLVTEPFLAAQHTTTAVSLTLVPTISVIYMLWTDIGTPF
jgi:hypothetical protein